MSSNITQKGQGMGKETIGVVGIGHMGLPMSRRLIGAGYPVIAYDLSADAVREAVESGAAAADSLADLGRRCATVITMLPNSAIIDAAVRSEGLGEAMAPGSTLIDMSTAVPARTVALARWLAEREVGMLDAPVSGGVAGAERGSLTIMVGGARLLYDRYHPLFEAMGKTIHYVGDTGAGHTIKAINNMVSATTMAVTSEALALAVKAGINVETALAVINSGTGRSWSSEYKFPTFVLNHAFNSGFSIGLMRKDVDIAIELGQEHAVPLFVAAAAQQLYRFAIGHGLGEQCHTTIATILEEMAGVRLDGTHEVIAEWRDSSGGGGL
ncbi:MAG TPA: NAD(P)-dependent oxidoreductase [Thermomicrobiales bacterium]